jgi:hypothetical protein
MGEVIKLLLNSKENPIAAIKLIWIILPSHVHPLIEILHGEILFKSIQPPEIKN